ncbi:MAG: hypothetical protein ACPLSO_00625 [Fervidicoccaceae archaeon]
MTEMKNEIYAFVASSILGEDVGKKISDEIGKRLEERGQGNIFLGSINNLEELKKLPQSDLVIIFVATGGTEDIITEAGNRSKSLHLFYHDSYNSLPATLESAAFLKQQGKSVHLHKYSGPDTFVETVERLSKAAKGASRLRNCRLGVVGGVSSWLVYSKASPEDVKRKVGAELVSIPLQELLIRFDSKKQNLSKKNLPIEPREVHVSDQEINKALAVHEALEEIAEKWGLCGLTVKCFDLIMARKTTACLSMSLMNTKVFPAACEGDIPLLISMALGEFATGKPAFMGNPSRVSGNELLIAHCTAPLISSFKLTTHFESGLGVGISVDYPVGEKATIFRLDSKLELLRIGVGEIKKWEWRTDLCRTQVLIEMGNAEKILRQSIGNHYALILGDVSDEIVAAGEIIGLNIDFI